MKSTRIEEIVVHQGSTMIARSAAWRRCCVWGFGMIRTRVDSWLACSLGLDATRDVGDVTSDGGEESS